MIANKLDFTFQNTTLTLVILSDTEAVLTDTGRMKFTAKFARASVESPWEFRNVAIHETPGFPYGKFDGLHPDAVRVATDWLGILLEGQKKLRGVAV